MKLFYTVVGMLVILFIITFSLTNTTPVHLKYYNIINFEVPSYLLIFISFGVGLIFAGFLDIVERLRLAKPKSYQGSGVGDQQKTTAPIRLLARCVVKTPQIPGP